MGVISLSFVVVIRSSSYDLLAICLMIFEMYFAETGWNCISWSMFLCSGEYFRGLHSSSVILLIFSMKYLVNVFTNALSDSASSIGFSVLLPVRLFIRLYSFLVSLLHSSIFLPSYSFLATSSILLYLLLSALNAFHCMGWWYFLQHLSQFPIFLFWLLNSSVNQGLDGGSVIVLVFRGIVLVFRGQACLVLLLIHYWIAWFYLPTVMPLVGLVAAHYRSPLHW